jgi:bifunctional UDP-N-acetylglucosamine pyrophosphorylase / glucosamine-1-phosphate N-acetyltransferase
MMQPNRSATAVVVLAAGAGTRMKSATPKALHPVLGVPMVGHVLRIAEQLKPGRMVVVTGHQRAAVEAWIGAQQWNCDVHFVEQAEQRGTGHAVKMAVPELGDAEEVLVLYCDGPLLTANTLAQLLNARGDGVVSLMTAEPPDAAKYGRVVLNGDGRVDRIVEHADANPEELAVPLINAGMMALQRRFLEDALGRLSDDNAQGELYLTDLLAMARDAGLPGASVCADWEEVQGINDRAELARASAILQRRVVAHWLAEGVAIQRPDDVVIETTVHLSRDVSVAGAVELRGDTTVGYGTRIDRGCVLNNVTVGEHTHLKPYSVATDTKIGNAAAVGPFAHLRPGTVLHNKVKVGNFVETKKAVLREAAKASHLSYVGDADVGAGSNIGAGTITCNYDGKNKFKTVLGEGVFIGSNTALVAPIEIGDGAYVGAGSTLTGDVPAQALAVARGRQFIKEGWAADK